MRWRPAGGAGFFESDAISAIFRRTYDTEEGRRAHLSQCFTLGQHHAAPTGLAEGFSCRSSVVRKRRRSALGGMRRHTTSGVHGVGCHAQAVSAGMPDTRCEPAVSGIDATVSGTEATVGGVEATVGGMPAPRHAGLGMPPAS